MICILCQFYPNRIYRDMDLNQTTLYGVHTSASTCPIMCTGMYLQLFHHTIPTCSSHVLVDLLQVYIVDVVVSTGIPVLYIIIVRYSVRRCKYGIVCFSCYCCCCAARAAASYCQQGCVRYSKCSRRAAHNTATSHAPGIP